MAGALIGGAAGRGVGGGVKGVALLLAATLSLGPGCGTTFGTVLLIDGAVTATTVATEAGSPVMDDRPETENPGNDRAGRGPAQPGLSPFKRRATSGKCFDRTVDNPSTVARLSAMIIALKTCSKSSGSIQAVSLDRPKPVGSSRHTRRPVSGASGLFVPYREIRQPFAVGRLPGLE